MQNKNKKSGFCKKRVCASFLQEISLMILCNKKCEYKAMLSCIYVIFTYIKTRMYNNKIKIRVRENTCIMRKF